LASAKIKIKPFFHSPNTGAGWRPANQQAIAWILGNEPLAGRQNSICRMAKRHSAPGPARGTNALMVRSERRHRIGQYVAERLTRECEAVRGTAIRISRETRISPSTITKIKDGDRTVGDDVVDAMMRYWGLSYTELEAAAFDEQPGRSRAHTEVKLPNLRATIDWLRGEMFPDAYLDEYEREARTRGPDRGKQEWFHDISARYFEWKNRKEEQAKARLRARNHRSAAARENVVRSGVVERDDGRKRGETLQTRSVTGGRKKA
jgi:hypothetical protein